jgi:hypothetical protein
LKSLSLCLRLAFSSNGPETKKNGAARLSRRSRRAFARKTQGVEQSSKQPYG